jgi:rRNA maturation protein Nop10
MTSRYLFCPICGARVQVDVPCTDYPEVHRIPAHKPVGNACPDIEWVANLCQGIAVTVTLDWDRCTKCGRKMSTHPSGVCKDCYKREGK